MTAKEKAVRLIADPTAFGWAVGYKNLTRQLHGKWIKAMLNGKGDMTLQAHRGSYKTTCLCIALALMLIKYRDKNIIFLRKTDSDVTEVIKNVQRILLHPVMQAMFRALTGSELAVDRCTASEINTSVYSAPRGSAQLLGIGIGGSLTGKHADIIITDDIVNLKDRVSHAERERTKAIYMELQNIRNPGGRIINTGTPWHKEDCFSIMPEAIRYDCYQTGMLGKEKLESLRRSMSHSLFAANYELKHIAAENALFAELPKTITDASLLYDGVAHVDAAFGGEDYTALTIGKRQGDKLYLYGRLWGKHIDRCRGEIIAECLRLRAAPIYCETNGDKGYLAKQLRNEGMAVRAYPEKMNKYLKISTYLRKWWGDVEILEGTDREYLSQIMDYTEDAEHDDAPDSAACICRILDRKGD